MNRKNLTAAVLAGLAGAAGIAGTAQAVNLNPDGLGDVLIYPYYTAHEGNQTILSVVNTTSSAKAVKVRFLEAYNSREVLDFNLYLSEEDVWVAAITEMDGVATLLIPDTSCTVPYLYGMGEEEYGMGVQEFLPYAYTGDNEDGGPTDLSRTMMGYVHIVEMGEMTGEDGRPVDTFDSDDPGRMDSEEAVTHVLDEETGESHPADCELLVRNWTDYDEGFAKDDPMDGWWFEDAASKCDDDLTDQENLDNGCGQTDGFWTVTSGGVDFEIYPSQMEVAGGLFGNGAVVNAANGTMFSYDAKAVQGYDTTNDGVHFEPGTIHPSLNDGSETDADVFLGQGNIANFDYDRGVDAISAVFMHDTLSNEFIVDDLLNAETDWVFTFPTKAWYVDPNLLGDFTFYTPDPDDPGCNGWDPGEPNPYPPDWTTDDPPPTGWELCTPIQDSSLNDHIPPFTERFDGMACEQVNYENWNREESPFVEDLGLRPPVVSPRPPGPTDPDDVVFELCYEVSVLHFGDSDIFGTPEDLSHTVDFTPDEGWARVDFNFPQNDDDQDLHQDSNGLRGLPVTGFAAQQYENGTLEGGSVLANYGGLFSHKGSVDVGECDLPEACS